MGREREGKDRKRATDTYTHVKNTLVTLKMLNKTSGGGVLVGLAAFMVTV